MFGKLDKTNESLPDLNAREIVLLLPILLFIVWIGVRPNSFLEPMKLSVDKVVERVNTETETPVVGQVIYQGETRDSTVEVETANLQLIKEEAQTK